MVLASKGVINGIIEANHALIAGKVNGEIKCTQEIHLASTADVIGNIFCTNLIVDDGALFNGNSTMLAQSNTRPSTEIYESEEN